MKKLDTKSFRRSVTVYITLVMVALIVIVAVSIVSIQKYRQDQREQEYASQIDRSINHTINHYVLDYSNMANRIVSTTNMAELLVQRDRNGIHDLINPKWNLIVKDEKNIAIMHLHLADGRSYYRAHMPDTFDDQLQEIRPLVNEVHKYHKPISGFETGKYHSAFRVVTPIFDKEQKYLGAFEIGLDLKFILDSVYEINKFRGMLFIKTDELGYFSKKNTPLKGEYSLQSEVNEELKSIIPLIQELRNDMYINVNDKVYRTHLFELKNYKNETKVKILFFQDITEAGMFRGYLLLGLSVVILFALLILIWSVYRRIKMYQNDVISIYNTQIDKLHESDNRFRLLYEKAPTAYQSLDYDGNLLIVNAKWCEELGYTEDEVIGKNFADFLLPEDIPLFKERFPKFRELGETREIEFEMMCKDGHIIDVVFYGKIIYDEKGNFSYSQCSLTNVTERKKIEKELDTERKKLKNIFNSMEDGVYIVNQNFDIEYVNPVLRKDFGEHDGGKCYKYFHDRDEVCPWCKNSEVLAGKIVRWEWYSFKNNKTYDLLDTPLYNADGTISKLEIFRDITENKLIEEKLKFNENYLQSIFDVTPNIMITSDGVEIDRINPAMLEFFGYETYEEFKSEHDCICDYFLGDDEFISAVMGDVPWLEYILARPNELHRVCMSKDAKKHIFMVWAKPLHVDDKNRSVIVFTDITEFEELSQSLLNSKLEFDMFMHFIPANILIKNSDGVIVYANESSNQFFGVESLVGKKAQDVLPPDKAEETDMFAQKIIEKGQHEEVNEFYNSKNEKVIVRTLGFKIEIEDTIQIGLVVIDITQSYLDKKELEEKDEMMIAQSRHAAMGEMISMIAHQWRQPISVIAMDANNILADIELEMVEEKSLKSASEDIINQTQELSKTIDDFRNFFRSEKEAKEIFVKELVGNALRVIGKSLENNNIEFAMEISESYKVTTFTRELMQVFINIIKNAKEALVEKEIKDKKITIYASEEKDDLVLRICDNAGGVKEENIEKIFNPYFTTKGEKNGTGLGLYMSKTIVEKHLGGFLSVENDENGACFEIRLPYSIN